MTQLIKATRVFVAALPSADAMRGHLSLPDHVFAPPTSTALLSYGFVPMDDDNEFVSEFPGGYAFKFRLEQKMIPASVIKENVAATCNLIEAETGRKPGKKEKREVREQVIEELASQAFSRPTEVTSYFHAASNRLFVPTLSKVVGDRLMSALVDAVETVKTETIHVSEVTQGLTARLTKWLGGDFDAFGGFSPVNVVDLEQGDRQVKVKMESLQQAQESLRSCLSQGFSVTSVGLRHNEMEFKLRSDFKLAAIHHDEVAGDAETESGFASDAATEVAVLNDVVDLLVEMFTYKEQTNDE